MLYRLKIFWIGFCMGIADIIPGVSGGTIAFISGIYETLINGIKSFNLSNLSLLLKFRIREFWKRIPFPFLIPLGLGILVALFSLSRFLDSLFRTEPEKLWAFFFGLILASIGILYRETRPWNIVHVIIFALTAVLTFRLLGLPITQTPPTPPYLFMAGAIAISAMILPGISGSYLLVILGKYRQILEIVNSCDFVSLAYFILGAVVGIFPMVRIVSYLLQKFRRLTILLMTAIMTGALRTVWPWKETIITRIDSRGRTVPLVQQAYLPTDISDIMSVIPFFLLGAAAVVLIDQVKPNRAQF